nr:protein TolQ [Ectothiorhodospira mobilis]
MTEVSVDLSLYRLVLDASWLVQAVMLLLLLASVFSWMIILIKARVLAEARRAAEAFEDRFWSGVELSHLYDTLRRREDVSGLEHVFTMGFKAFLQHRRQARDPADRTLVTGGAERAMRVAIAREGERLEGYLPVLATIASTSPYVGLFGTVWGIMNAFMGLSGERQATLAMVAPGIAEALIATALGLFAAIPAVIAYNAFSARVDRLLGRYDNFADELSGLLQRQPVPREREAAD